MGKKKGVVIGIILILLVFLAGLFFYGVIEFPFEFDYSFVTLKVSEIFGIISSYFIRLFEKLPWEINANWVKYISGGLVIFILFLASLMKFIRSKKSKHESSLPRRNLPKKSKSETDLDVLYNLIKTKKVLNLDSVSRIFKIPKEKSLEWVKILESHDLVAIEYPTFSTPIIKTNEKENKKQTKKEHERKVHKKNIGKEKEIKKRKKGKR